MNDVVRLDGGRFHRSLSRLDGSLLAIPQFHRAKLVRQLHLAIKHREDGAAIVGDGEMEFRAANRGGGSARFELHVHWFVAVEKVEQPLAETERRFVRRVWQWFDEELGEFRHAHRALIEQMQRGPAAFAGADAVGDVQHLIRLRGSPCSGLRDGGFNLALLLQHDDLVFARGGGDGKQRNTGEGQEQDAEDRERGRGRGKCVHAMVPCWVAG